MLDLRFPTSLQIMLSLALAEDHCVATVTSAQLADGLGANPSLVRKIIVPLVQQGLIESSVGKNGGLRLGRPASEITLREIYAVGTGEKTLWNSRSDIPHRCLVSSNIESFFENLSHEADDILGKWLEGRTLADALIEIRRMAEKRPPIKVRVKARA